MSKNFTLSRRSLLRGLGGACVALPWLEAMGQTAPVKRLVVMFSPNGTVPGQFWPTGSESAWNLSPILTPLARHKADLLVLKGVDMKSASHGPGDGHVRGIGHLLTGTEMLSGSSAGAGLAGGISVDQHIANAIRGSAPYKSLEFGVVARGVSSFDSVDGWSRLNFSGPGTYVPVENNPWTMFNRVFSNLPSGGSSNPPPATDPALLRNRAVVDLVLPEYRALSTKLGAADRHRLDAHLALVEQLQTNLKATQPPPPPPPTGCVKPTLPTAFDHKSDGNIQRTGQLQMQMLSLALGCGLTKVATLQWSRAYGLSVMGSAVSDTNGAPIAGAHHALSHNTGADAQRQLTLINTWYATQLASLIDMLKAIPEGNGSVFDNTVIVWGNELGEGASHTTSNIPFVLAGRLGGHFRTGRFVDFSSSKKPHNNLWVSLCNAFGLAATTFGNPAYCTGALSGLT